VTQQIAFGRIGILLFFVESRYLTGAGIGLVKLYAVDLRLVPIKRAKIFLSLVAAIRRWAETLNASQSFIHVITGSNIAATDRLVNAVGAMFVGGAYMVILFE